MKKRIQKKPVRQTKDQSQQEGGYANLIQSSFRKFEENPILLVPNALALLSSLALAVLLLSMTGILGVIMAVPAALTKGVYLVTAVYALMTADPARFWGVVTLYLVAEFFVSLFFITTKYGMIKDVILVGRTSLKSGFAFGKKHLLDVTGIYILSLLMILAPMLLIVLAGVILMPRTLLGGIVVMGLFALLAILYAGFVIYRLIFVYPIMAFEQEGPMRSIRDDFHYVKTHIGHTFITWIVLLCMGAVYVIIKSPIETLKGIATDGYLIILLTGIIAILEVLVSTWEHIFIFKAYLAGKRRNRSEDRAKHK